MLSRGGGVGRVGTNCAFCSVLLESDSAQTLKSVKKMLRQPTPAQLSPGSQQGPHLPFPLLVAILKGKA